MTPIVQRIIEGTITAILAFWLFTHANQFNAVATASRTAVVGSFQALSGR